MEKAVQASPEHPVLIDKFLEDATFSQSVENRVGLPPIWAQDQDQEAGVPEKRKFNCGHEGMHKMFEDRTFCADFAQQ